MLFLKRIGSSLTGSKIILMGEHFVVYGVGAIALPFSSATASIQVWQDETDYIKSSLYTGSLDASPKMFEGLRDLILSLKQDLKIEHGVHVSIDSNIPLQRGMGSSAAISIGIAKAFYDYVQEPINKEALKAYASKAEDVHHSNASGIDIETILSKGPIVFQKAKEYIGIEEALDAYLLLVDSKIKGSTKIAVEQVYQFTLEHPVTFNKMLEDYQILLKEALDAYQNNQASRLGMVMNQNHQLLQALGISEPSIDEWIEDALDHGALGAKITGGGLGGCFIILLQDQEQVDLLTRYYKNEGLDVRSLYLGGIKHE